MLFWGLLTGPSPVDRARTGSKHHLLVEASGIPLAMAFTGGNRNDITQLLLLLEGLHSRPWPADGAVRVESPIVRSPTAAMTTTSPGERYARSGSGT